MSERIKQNYVPPSAGDFAPYERTDSKIIPIRTDRLSLSLLVGDERNGLLTPVAGDASLVLRYKGREGGISSIATHEEQIEVVQLQGAHQEGYRVNTSLNWHAMMADQIVGIAMDPRNEIRRLLMPYLGAIMGAIDAEETALKRYEEFAARAGLSLSMDERAWVRDIKR